MIFVRSGRFAGADRRAVSIRADGVHFEALRSDGEGRPLVWRPERAGVAAAGPDGLVVIDSGLFGDADAATHRAGLLPTDAGVSVRVQHGNFRNLTLDDQWDVWSGNTDHVVRIATGWTLSEQSADPVSRRSHELLAHECPKCSTFRAGFLHAARVLGHSQNRDRRAYATTYSRSERAAAADPAHPDNVVQRATNDRFIARMRPDTQGAARAQLGRP